MDHKHIHKQWQIQQARNGGESRQDEKDMSKKNNIEVRLPTVHFCLRVPVDGSQNYRFSKNHLEELTCLEDFCFVWRYS